MTENSECSSCKENDCSAQARQPGEAEAEYLERQSIAARMCLIKHKLIVLSGKGGVGKSTVAVNLAVALSMAGKQVGLLDIDIHGPSIPKLLHLEGANVTGTENGIAPVEVGANLKVMSIGFLMQKRDDAVIWRGPMKYTVIKQFLTDVNWGELDYLIVDSPPGTGDEPLAVVQIIGDLDGGIIVTTPQELAVLDVRRSVNFCRQLKLPVLGVIENMSGFTCPSCSEHFDIFGSGGGEIMAREFGIPFLGAIPIDPLVTASGDRGEPIIQGNPHSETAKAFGRVVRSFLERDFDAAPLPVAKRTGGDLMKIAIPVANGLLCQHFGHCERVILFNVEPQAKTIQGSQLLTPPPHEPGVFPRWLHEQGADVIIAGGMGARAQSLFTQNNIQVIVGAPSEDPEHLVRAYLDGNLTTGPNICDH